MGARSQVGRGEHKAMTRRTPEDRVVEAAFPSLSPIKVPGGWFYETASGIDVVSERMGGCRISRKALERYLKRTALAKHKQGKR